MTPGARFGLAAAMMATVALAARPMPSTRPLELPPLRVAVTVPPQKWLVRRLAGEGVDLQVLLPPGTSPHTYEPTPLDVARLARAQLVIEVGHPSFLFERRLLATMLRRDAALLVVDMSRGAPLLHDSGGLASETDPHLWLSPAVMRQAAHAVAAALTRLQPAAASGYDQRLAAVLAEIARLDVDLKRTFAALPHRRFLVYHPAWGYFAHDYGLEQVAIESAGKEPSPRQLVALVEQARRDGTRTIFTQVGLSDRPARAIGEEIGARLVPLDPMAEDWPENLRRTATLLRKALGG